jgi:hypothetical protein
MGFHQEEHQLVGGGFVSGKSSGTVQTLATPPNGAFIFGWPGVNNSGVTFSAKWAFHVKTSYYLNYSPPL